MSTAQEDMSLAAVSIETLIEVQQFLYREARIQDMEKFREWLTMLTDDVHYWMPYRYQRYRKNEKEPTIYDQSYYCDTMQDLEKRIIRTETGTCWS